MINGRIMQLRSRGKKIAIDSIIELWLASDEAIVENK
jgi:hypothetical protein